MKGVILLLISVFCLQVTGFSQSVITGNVVDKKENLKLENATIMLLQAKDSILVDFVRTNSAGKFELKKPNQGDFLVIVSYPKYADFYQLLSPNSEGNLGDIGLQSVENLIEEVVVNRRAAITLKGDTTEYDASQFTVEKNAKVEDLLKVLPGITVDASGKITAQGKTVEKVLVDGEEFFGDDPILVTRNIRSDMVDKVQVYEKKSDQAERTGVDDGIRTQTINVKLKEDAKHGVFGKAEAGVGTDKFYLGQGFLNYFKKSLRVSAFLITSNNGKTSLSGNESDIIDGGEWGDGNYRGEGIPVTTNTGLFYSDKSANDKHKWRLDYKYNQLSTDVDRNVFIQNSLRDTVLLTNSDSKGNNSNKRNNFSFKNESKFDSLTTLTIWAGAGNNNSENISNSISKTVDQFGNRINESNRDFYADSKSTSFNASGLFTRKFSKQGRSLSFYYGLNGAESKGNQLINSKLSYYVDNAWVRDDVIDQRKLNDDKSFDQGASLSYSEPFSKKFVATVEYKLNNTNNSNKVESYNKDATTGEYDQFDALFSNNFDYNTFKNTYSLSFNYKPIEKINFNMSNFLEQSSLKQVDNYTNNEMKRSFLVYAPNIRLNYDISKTKQLNVDYRGENILPSLSQIQPLRSNIDPLNEYLGNENLINAYTHNVSAFMRSTNIMTFTFWGGGITGASTKDALIQNVLTDSEGKNTYTWENLSANNNKSITLFAFYYTTLIKKYQIRHGISPNFSVYENYNYINGTLAKATNENYTLGYGIQKSTTKGLDFDLNLRPGYSVQRNSIRKDSESNGFTFNVDGNFKYFLPKKFQFETNFTYIYQAPTEVYKEKFERFLINPSLSKKFLANETLMLTLAVNDILNQNVGYSRNQSGTQLTERRYNTIGRYYMLKMSWEINKMFVKSN
ncbi:outer membrane beta-barrel protein [Sphingobacterium rhinopitheci]|uniref:outer membrane beta-barrel protein n=1 Tax=Sphingobacterium rhinopitheci TaxID=2781960 RepID=UPI001F520C89|nr:outer membrane beta-barrel protein [Sphingobacterium rhinopitheci]MCI0922378.1 outer membrane beta-barrel protein [Sphingobacterium rhinopitheci]